MESKAPVTARGEDLAGQPLDHEAARWPIRLQELAIQIREAGDSGDRERARGEVWVLLNSSISRYLRIHCSRYVRLPREDLEDIAAEKSLDLLCKIESAEWEFSTRHPSEIAGFLSSVARNGLLDRLRRMGRRMEQAAHRGPRGTDQESLDRIPTPKPADAPDLLVRSKEFATALMECTAQLPERARLAWFFRVFFQLSSKEIADHPEVGMRASHVDVVLQRTRQAIKDCMHGRGHESHDIPPGTFVELWKAYRLGVSTRHQHG